MGLTISYQYRFVGTEREVRDLFFELPLRFLKLPLARIGGPFRRQGFPSYALHRIRELEGHPVEREEREEIAELLDFVGVCHDSLPVQDELLPEAGPSPFEPSREPGPGTRIERRGDWVLVEDPCFRQAVHVPTEELRAASLRAHLIEVAVGEGCEPFHVRLACVGDGYAWAGAGFTKTQYATDFTTCHLAVIRMLELCREEGLEVEVHDEGGFWGTYDWQALSGSLCQSTNFIRQVAAAFGAGSHPDVLAPITGCANYLTVSGQGPGYLPDWFVERRDLDGPRPRRRRS